MTEATSDFCAAYGCPLFGTYGSGGKWFCFCHRDVDSGRNDAITAELHRHKATVDRIMLARREGRADAQLENGLLLLVRDVGMQQNFRAAGVIGPEYAEPHFTEDA